jgi:hypothetical protein
VKCNHAGFRSIDASTWFASMTSSQLHFHRRRDDSVGSNEGGEIRMAPARYVTIKSAAAAMGLSEGAIRKRIERGIWLRDKHYRRAPDGHLYIDLKAIEAWIESKGGTDDQ